VRKEVVRAIVCLAEKNELHEKSSEYVVVFSFLTLPSAVAFPRPRLRFLAPGEIAFRLHPYP
jgi:hypothetical protein